MRKFVIHYVSLPVNGVISEGEIYLYAEDYEHVKSILGYLNPSAGIVSIKLAKTEAS